MLLLKWTVEERQRHKYCKGDLSGVLYMNPRWQREAADKLLQSVWHHATMTADSVYHVVELNDLRFVALT